MYRVHYCLFPIYIAVVEKRSRICDKSWGNRINEICVENDVILIYIGISVRWSYLFYSIFYEMFPQNKNQKPLNEESY